MNNHPLRLLGNSTRMVHIPIRQRVIAAVWGAVFGTGTLEKLPAASAAGGSSREKSSANPVVSAPWANREMASGPKRTGVFAGKQLRTWKKMERDALETKKAQSKKPRWPPRAQAFRHPAVTSKIPVNSAETNAWSHPVQPPTAAAKKWNIPVACNRAAKAEKATTKAQIERIPAQAERTDSTKAVAKGG